MGDQILKLSEKDKALTFREFLRRFEHLDAIFYTENMVLATLKICWYMNENGGNVINL